MKNLLLLSLACSLLVSPKSLGAETGLMADSKKVSAVEYLYNRHMKEESVRTTVDIPAPLYRKLKEQAAAKGSSVRELVLMGVKGVLLQEQRPRPRRVQFPLIVSKGPKVNLSNEQIYEYVEFP